MLSLTQKLGKRGRFAKVSYRFATVLQMQDGKAAKRAGKSEDLPEQ